MGSSLPVKRGKGLRGRGEIRRGYVSARIRLEGPFEMGTVVVDWIRVGIG